MSDDLDKLQRDLGTIPRYSGRFVRSALAKTAQDIRDGWREIASEYSSKSLDGYAHSVDYDVSGDFPTYEAEIGPNHEKRQGRFGFIEDANGGVNASPQKARPQVIRDNEADFEKGLDRAVDDALKRAGL